VEKVGCQGYCGAEMHVGDYERFAVHAYLLDA
jgi:hypothetical protein